jgi:hypothetical protein
MNCPKFGFVLNESLENSYCKNCDFGCNETQTELLSTSVKIEVHKSQAINNKPINKEPVTLLTCPECKKESLFVFPDNFHVECLNNNCKKAGIIFKDGENTVIRLQ